jgi:hypothetical protein
MRQSFHQAYTTQGKTSAKYLAMALTQNDLRAASADIQQQYRSRCQIRVCSHALEHHFRLLVAGEDCDWQFCSASDGRNEIPRITRFASSARGDDANLTGPPIARQSGILGDGIRRGGNRFGRQAVRFVEAFSQTSLVAAFQSRLHLAAANVSKQDLDRVGADINDGAALEFGSEGHENSKE